MPLPLIFWLLLAAAQPPESPRPASVSGRVVDAVTGRPIAGVIVAPAGPAVPTGPAHPLPPRALTNGQGEFVLRGLRAGTVYFTAARNGYADATYNQRRPGGSGQGVRLEPGKQADDIEIRMWRHAAITGTIVDEAGEPAIGVRVQAFTRWFVAGRRRFAPAGAGVTDDRGIYRIPNLTPGDYAVGIISTQRAVPTEIMDLFSASSGSSLEQRARLSRELGAIGAAVVRQGSAQSIAIGGQTLALPPGTLVPHTGDRGTIAIYPTTFFPAAAGLGQAAVFTVKSGEERGSIDLQLRPVQTAQVSGTVVAPDGLASNLGVRLVPAASEDVVDSIDVAATLTTDNGSFLFPVVPPGQYVLRVVRPPRDPIDVQANGIRTTPEGAITVGTTVSRASASAPPPAPIPVDATLCADLAISVGDSPLSDLIIPLTVGPRVSGRVEFEGGDDKPPASDVTRIRINLDPADGSKIAESSLAFQAGHPDDDGTFRTFGVPPGRYVLRVNAPAGWYLKGAFLGMTDLAESPFDLTSKDLSGVVITFTDRPSTLSGVVRAGLKADPDAVVVAYPTDTSSWSERGAFPRRMRTARTDRDGAYTIAGLVPGEYHVVAVHEDTIGDWQDPALLDALSRVARQVRVFEGERRSEDLVAAVIR